MGKVNSSQAQRLITTHDFMVYTYMNMNMKLIPNAHRKYIHGHNSVSFILSYETWSLLKLYKHYTGHHFTMVQVELGKKG